MFSGSREEGVDSRSLFREIVVAMGERKDSRAETVGADNAMQPVKTNHNHFTKTTNRDHSSL